MNKFILAFALFIVLFALAEATGPQCQPQCKPKDASPLICAQDAKGKVCRRLKECTLREENCRLRSRKEPILQEANMKKCRNLKKKGSGKCARIGIRSAVRNCSHPQCKDNGKTSCWRSSKGNCLLLTGCQAQRANCLRGSRNLLKRWDSRACYGMKLGQNLQKCRAWKHV